MNKNEIISFLSEVELLIQQQLSILQILVQKYDKMQYIQQRNLEKSLKRIKIFFSIESQDQSLTLPKQQEIEPYNNFIIQNTKVNKQEPFTIEDWQLIEQGCIEQDSSYQENLKFVKLYQINELHPLSEAEVDEKTCDFKYERYYGYKINGTFTGRGLQIKNKSVSYGYFIMNKLEEGIVVQNTSKTEFILIIFKNQQSFLIKIQFLDEIIISNANSNEVEIEKCLLIVEQIFDKQIQVPSKLDKMRDLIQKLILSLYNTKLYKPTFLVTTTGQLESSFKYLGQAKYSNIQGQFYVKEGFGMQFDPLTIGLWKDDKCIENFQKYVKIFSDR